MNTTDSTSKVRTTLSKPICQRLEREKLGRNFGSVMLFPPPALDDAQIEEQEEKGCGYGKNHRPRIDRPPREIMHLVKQVEHRQHLCLPMRGDRGSLGHVGQRKKAHAQHEADDGCHHLGL